MRLTCPTFMTLLLCCGAIASAQDTAAPLGIDLIPIPGGSYTRGQNAALPEGLGGPSAFQFGDWDEHPAHQVEVAAFLMSASEITTAQFQAFQPQYQGAPGAAATGITWHEAQAFCEWLSARKGKPYRLPTEAEWEYACRAGTTTPFWAGDAPPQQDTNPWGLRNLHTPPAEWCLDWYGEYPRLPQRNPAGPGAGITKVVRGGAPSLHDRQGITVSAPYYHRSANRASAAPAYPPRHQAPELAQQSWGNIGFRVVQAPMPTSFAAQQLPFAQYGVKATEDLATQGPDPAAPFLRRRAVLPIPPDNTPWPEYGPEGLFPGLLPHFHSPGLVACDNGDLLLSYFCSFTSHTEYWPHVAFTIQRLRYGAREWDLPELFFDFADVPEETPLFFKDGNRLWYVTGGVGLDGVPFKWMTSSDHGATWGPVQFPVFTTPIGPHTAQPISSMFRDARGTLYLASDGDGATSVLWKGFPDATAWSDPLGRTGGRHTVFTLLKNGDILGMGGKSSDIEGFMPRSISRDAGALWQVDRTPFAALGSNQRPSLLRLQSGRLFFAGDYQRNFDGIQPEGLGQHGAYVALSEDEGETWHIKPFPLARPHEKRHFPDREDWAGPEHDQATLGYSVAAQSPDGLIHLMTTMNHPNLHFALNEAWILDASANEPTGSGPVLDATRFEELGTGDTIRFQYGGGRNAQGEFLLHGHETWYDEGGRQLYRAQWQHGAKVQLETFRPGVARWEWRHGSNPREIREWKQYWPDGTLRTATTWQSSAGVLHRLTSNPSP